MTIRLLLIVWVYGFFALAIYTLADTVFGAGSFAARAKNFVPRLAISLAWPLAVITPRGRYLLWKRWRASDR